MVDIADIVSSLVDDKVQLAIFMNAPPGMQIARTDLIRGLIPRNMHPDAAESFQEAELWVTILTTGQVLTEENHIFSAGPKFQEFQTALREYLDPDNVIMRVMQISRRDYDEIVREFTEIHKESNYHEDIFESWADLPVETKQGILRGIFVQRGILANVLSGMKQREEAVVKFHQETLQWIDTTLTN